jgi:polyisoprenoid-binding protein YceI
MTFAGALAAALLWSLSAIAADAPTKYQGMPIGSKVVIDGDSTTHKWSMVGNMIGGTIFLDPGVTLDNSQATLPVKDGVLSAKVQAIISVRSLHSTATTKPDIMDNLYAEALKDTQFPKITYTATQLKLKDGHAAGKPFEFEATGELSIAGVTNKVSFPVTISTDSTDKNKIHVKGSAPLKMTAFGITPPAPNIGLGLMKCADDVTITFDWLLKVRSTEAAPAAAAPAAK